MILLPPDFKEFVLLLKKHKVEFLIVGGYALAFHGRPRFTGDLDIWVCNRKDNIENLLRTLTEFGFSSLDLSSGDFTDEAVIQLGYPPLRIDLLTTLTGIEWQSASGTAVTGIIDGIEIPFIDKASLIANKRALGRARDIADVENLE